MEAQHSSMEGLWSLPLPSLWLHRCHGMDAPQLKPVQIDRKFPGSIAEWFDAEADHSENMLGLQCHFDTAMLFVETTTQGLVPVVTELFLAEVSCHPFRSETWQDMAVIAIVPPKSGTGIRGTAILGSEFAGREGWFMILQGISTAHAVMDILSLRGCLRNDLSQSLVHKDIDQIIGEGAYATVHHMQARDGRPVAVKNMNYTSDFESIARETSALVEVRGDHIVAFRGLFWRQEAEQVRLSMVFDLAVSGDLLFKVLQSGMMTESAARSLFTGILQGLKRIHSFNIVHRDIKTENILLNSGDVPLVADFGLACKTTDEQQMTRRCGSAGFVAPEVCLGTPYDCKVDTFGAGVILFFMLSKELPFSSPDRDSAATMRKTVKCNIHLQRPPFNELSSRARNMLRQLICKNQEERLSAQAALEHSWIIRSGRRRERGADAGAGDVDEVGHYAGQPEVEAPFPPPMPFEAQVQDPG